MGDTRWLRKQKVTDLKFNIILIKFVVNILGGFGDGHSYENKNESLKKRIMNYTLIQVDGIAR